jgi:hypothetical protein
MRNSITKTELKNIILDYYDEQASKKFTIEKRGNEITLLYDNDFIFYTFENRLIPTTRLDLDIYFRGTLIAIRGEGDTIYDLSLELSYSSLDWRLELVNDITNIVRSFK